MVSCHIRFGKPTLNHKPYICQVLHSLGKRLPAWLLLHSFHIKCMHYFFRVPECASHWQDIGEEKSFGCFQDLTLHNIFPSVFFFFQRVLLDKETLCRGWPQAVIPHFDTKGVVLLQQNSNPFNFIASDFSMGVLGTFLERNGLASWKYINC